MLFVFGSVFFQCAVTWLSFEGAGKDSELEFAWLGYSREHRRVRKEVMDTAPSQSTVQRH